MLHHVQGRQIRESHSRLDRNGHIMHQGHQGHNHHHHSSSNSIGHGGGGSGSNLHTYHNIASPQQYTSYEEFQRAMENPFDKEMVGVNLTVPLGDTAYLKCKVRNLGERSVRHKNAF